MTAEMVSIDAKTSYYVPTNDFINVKVDAVGEVRDTLEGHLQVIIE